MKKLLIVLFISLFVCGNALAFTAHRKGQVIYREWQGNKSVYLVLIGDETVEVSSSEVTAYIGDDVMVLIDRLPYSPKLSIIYKFIPPTPPPGSEWHPPEDTKPPGTKF
ncbi:MAG: hypothetical protein P9L97_06005 [Candidatus Tenebribacter davisii]|nr:hypothetical protein [Candidatus Tenebribacter davisii]